MSDKIKDIVVKDETFKLGDVISQLQEHEVGLDRVRSVLALRMNQYNSIDLTKNDIQAIAKSFKDIETGSSTNLVVICSKTECLYKGRCQLYVADKCPEGLECMHENYILAQSMNMYLESLSIDLNNYPEMVLVNQLVEYEVIEYRCNAILSNYHKDLRMESVVGVDRQGNIVTKEEMSHALSIKLLVFKNKMQILQDFTATRKEKYKKQVALKETKESQVKTLSSIKAKIKEIKKGNIDVEQVHEELNALQDESIGEYNEY